MTKEIALTQGQKPVIYEKTYHGVALEVGFLARQHDLADIIAGLNIIALGTGDRIRFVGGLFLEFQLCSNKSEIFRENGGFCVKLRRADLVEIMNYLIEYFRDGSATVDHVDVEVEFCGGPIRECVLVVRSERFAPLISVSEVKKRLSLE